LDSFVTEIKKLFSSLLHVEATVKLSEVLQMLGSKGKPAKVIIVAIMRKLLHIVFGVVKHNTCFNPDFLLDA
jgi:hypothetical protein